MATSWEKLKQQRISEIRKIYRNTRALITFGLIKRNERRDVAVAAAAASNVGGAAAARFVEKTPAEKAMTAAASVAAAVWRRPARHLGTRSSLTRLARAGRTARRAAGAWATKPDADARRASIVIWRPAPFDTPARGVEALSFGVAYGPL